MIESYDANNCVRFEFQSIRKNRYDTIRRGVSRRFKLVLVNSLNGGSGELSAQFEQQGKTVFLEWSGAFVVRTRHPGANRLALDVAGYIRNKYEPRDPREFVG